MIAVSSKPAGATRDAGEPGGAAHGARPHRLLPASRCWPASTRSRSRSDGYRTETRAVSIAPEATETPAVPLTRTLASACFVTEPAGVEIWIDGELRATTAGNLAPDLHEVARAKGLDPARAAARVEIANLSLGSHARRAAPPLLRGA